MCSPLGALPPPLPADLRTVSGGAGSEDVVLTSKDGPRFRARLAKAAGATSGVVILPDVRGLHPFYEQLAERFADAGISAIAIDYFGRTAGTGRRLDDFPWRDHLAKTTPATIQADIAGAIGHVRGAIGARGLFVLGFCFGGRNAFESAAEQTEIAGVVGFYGRLSAREGEDGATPKDRTARMRAPVLGLFGGADPGIPAEEVAAFERALAERRVPHHLVTYPGAPHSFFDRSFADHREACDDAWRRVLGFIRTGDPTARA